MFAAQKLIQMWYDLKQKPCPRCGLPYDRRLHQQCPHCSHLSERETEDLRETTGNHSGSRGIPWSFLALAGIVMVIIFLLKQFV